jgi:hypothetical protein
VKYSVGSLTSVETVADSYYSAVKSQDYTTAYNYVQISNLTQDSFTQQAQQLDTSKGSVTSYVVGTPAQDTTQTGAFTVVVKVVRGGSHSYNALLTIAQVGKSWKITSYDTI